MLVPSVINPASRFVRHLTLVRKGLKRLWRRYIFATNMRLNNSAQTWECLVREKQDAREEALEVVARCVRSGEFRTAPTSILEGSDLPTLVSRIAAGEITAQTLTTAAIYK